MSQGREVSNSLSLVALQGEPQRMGAALGFTLLRFSTALRVATLGYPGMYFVISQSLQECYPSPMSHSL